MTGPGLPRGRDAAADQLLAQLGLPPSTSPEGLDEHHEAVSQFLAAAPAELRGWAHAQAASLDQAYLLLTDPVGLEGSALRSPTRPPTVVPGGPATPPARRGPVAPALPEELDEDDEFEDELEDEDDEELEDEPEPVQAATARAADEPDLDDLDALYASVTPSAHRDSTPSGSAKPKARPVPVAPVPAPRRKKKARAVAPAPVVVSSGSPVKKLAGIGIAVVAVAAILFGGYQLGPGAVAPTASPAAPIASAVAVDQAKVGALMAKLQANPKDTATMLALANEFYAGQQFEQAATFLDQLLAIDPVNVEALLARGAVYFNLNDLPNAETTWKKVVAIEPNNVEVHYDLGFLYLNSPTPDWAGVQREWNKVIELDPTSQLATTVKSHLDSLAANSMLPSASGSPAPSASADAGASPATSPAGSPAGSPAASPAASAAPSASAPASTQP